ncbi:uncharacterized protein LOC104898961 isoform X3 [Beta vulgaris subsp. vulgaris]|uniref:uncharacterized protein LOC104898961 isoform X3 n=1 Tax=Beta vulgaris subsp. vulgaris TaxID=3555 RepID=UPI0025492792|nr:uncharacterized protein LOC104898961 isoform X3 [Beta vulgaris subsp. vulgaris]
MLFKSITAGDKVSEMLDQHTQENEKQFEPCTSSASDREARRLINRMKMPEGLCAVLSIPNTRILPVKEMQALVELQVKRFDMKATAAGGRCITKRRPSSQLQPHKQGYFWSVLKDKDPNSSSDDKLLYEAEASDYQPIDRTSPVLVRGCDGETSKSSLTLPMATAIQHDHHRCSMADLLDSLQGKIRNPHLKSKLGGKRKGQGKRDTVTGISSSGEDIGSDKESCEFIDAGFLTDKEENSQILELAIVEPGRKTMADKFQEAFASASMDDRRPSFTVVKQSKCSAGLFGRLQHIMQRQKEEDAEVLKKVQSEVCLKDEARCIDVKILSRSFDAKLSVCHCSLLKNESSLQNPQQENIGKIWTVIFNSRVCGDVDLEVGNLIRIYPPWVGEDTYDSRAFICLEF